MCCFNTRAHATQKPVTCHSYSRFHVIFCTAMDPCIKMLFGERQKDFFIRNTVACFNVAIFPTHISQVTFRFNAFAQIDKQQ